MGHSTETAGMLSVRNLTVSYRRALVLDDLSLEVGASRITAMLGPNGAGKTTLLKAVAGLLKPQRGRVLFMGERIDGMPPWDVVRRGLVYVPEGMRVFPEMSVNENLEVGAYANRSVLEANRQLVFDLFPELTEKRQTRARFLSGGEQRMVTLARGLMSAGRLLLLDDPFQGLSPKSVERFSHAFRSIQKAGVTLLIVGQHVRRILKVSDWGLLMEGGRITVSGPSEELLRNPHLLKILFGLDHGMAHPPQSSPCFML